MTDVVVPVTTVWDVVASALDDVWFWGISAVTMISFSLILRVRLSRRI